MRPSQRESVAVGVAVNEIKNGIGRLPVGLSGLVVGGAPGRIRTFDLRIRSPPLYPLSYGRP